MDQQSIKINLQKISQNLKSIDFSQINIVQNKEYLRNEMFKINAILGKILRGLDT